MASPTDPDSPFAPETALASLVGAREEQQDRVEIFRSGGECLLVLADGLGGHEGGAEAAQTVVDEAGRLFVGRGAAQSAAATGPLPAGPEQLLRDIACGAHWRMRRGAGVAAAGPGCTCLLLHLTRRRAIWAHVGDSRLYRFRDGRLSGRTLDHSVVELLRLKGRISEAEMKSHPDRNRLLEALGGSAPPRLEFDRKPARASDGFLLCSDGLWENVSDSQLEQAMRAGDLQAGLDGLVRRARATGGADCDNISVAAVRCQPLARGPEARQNHARLAAMNNSMAGIVQRILDADRPLAAICRNRRGPGGQTGAGSLGNKLTFQYVARRIRNCIRYPRSETHGYQARRRW